MRTAPPRGCPTISRGDPRPLVGSDPGPPQHICSTPDFLSAMQKSKTADTKLQKFLAAPEFDLSQIVHGVLNDPCDSAGAVGMLWRRSSQMVD